MEGERIHEEFECESFALRRKAFLMNSGKQMLSEKVGIE